MITSLNNTDANNIDTLVARAEQLLGLFSPSRSVQRIATALRQLAQTDNQPLRLAIVADNLDDSEALAAEILTACSAIEIRRLAYDDLASNPRLLQETVQWHDGALFVTAGTRPTVASQSMVNALAHCLRNSIVVGESPDHMVAGTIGWSARTSAPNAGNRFASAVIPLKHLARAQQLAAYARHIMQLLGQSMQHYKLMLKLMERPARAVAVRSTNNIDSDKAWLPMRDSFGERTVMIERELVIASERATQPLGELSGQLRAIVNGVSEDDLESSRTSSQLKLSINAGHLATLNRRFEHMLHERFTRDLKQAEQLVRVAMHESYRQYSTEQRLNDSKLLGIDIQRAWRSVENLMAIGKEAAIELPRKGVFDLLTAGRQKVFIIIMFISLMGRMGLPKLFTTPTAHLGFGVFMATVMIASMVFAIGRWRKENAQTIEKEIQKFRDNLLAEGSKVIEQVERVKLNAMRDYCKEANRLFESICKTQIEATYRQQQARVEELQQRQDAAYKVMEGRLKQLADMERPVQRFVESVGAYQEACQREWLKLADCSAVPIQSMTPASKATSVVASESVPVRVTGALAERRARRLQTKTSSV